MVIKSINDLKKKENARQKSRSNKSIKIKDDGNNCKLFSSPYGLRIKKPAEVMTHVHNILCPSCNKAVNVNQATNSKFRCRCGAEFYLRGKVLSNANKNVR